MYRDLDVPGVSISQLKKNTFFKPYGDSRKTGEDFKKMLRIAISQRPNYADLMGSIEQHADHVIMPYNPLPILAQLEPPEETAEWFIWEEQMRGCDGKAEIILALSRSKKFPQRRSVEWHGETTSFGKPIVGRQESLFEEI
jgi:replicative DNA helicase